jgi:uncharacterized protein
MLSNRTIAVIVISFLLIIGILLAGTYFSVNRLLFLPTNQLVWEPTIPYRKVLIEDRIHGWLFENHPENKIVLFCHGNFLNISHHDFIVELCHRSKLNLLIFDYSGYGLSEGKPNTKVVCEDGEKAYQFLLSKYDPEDIILWAQSLGGAVATYIAERNHCSSLILMSTFSSLDDAARDSERHILFKKFVCFVCLIHDNMNTKVRIQNVKCPVIILHSRLDDVIPFENAERLYDSVSHSKKKLIEIGGGHVNPKITLKQLREIFSYICLDNSTCSRVRDILSDICHLDRKYGDDAWEKYYKAQ